VYAYTCVLVRVCSLRVCQCTRACVDVCVCGCVFVCVSLFVSTCVFEMFVYVCAYADINKCV